MSILKPQVYMLNKLHFQVDIKKQNMEQSYKKKHEIIQKNVESLSFKASLCTNTGVKGLCQCCVLFVYLLSNWIPPVFGGEKHFAQLLYSRPLFLSQHLLAEVSLQNLVMGLNWAGQGVWPFYRLQSCSVKNMVPSYMFYYNFQ